MHKLLIVPMGIALAFAAGCSSTGKTGNDVPVASSKPPLVYRPNIQQGNVVSQEAVNQLKPGMTRSQVQYLLGTPMLVDVFHQDRWDYYYSMEEGGDVVATRRLTLRFRDDWLVEIEGNLRPDPQADPMGTPKEVIYSVPDHDSGGLFSGKKGGAEAAD